MKPLACPGCGATRGLATDTVYNLANGSRRRLRICSHCKGRVRTIQPSGGPEQLSQEPLSSPTARPGIKLTSEKVVEIREAAAAGAAHKVIAERYGVRWQTIAQVVYGDTWPQAGGPIKQRKKKARQTCASCEHFDGRCSFGFPEAVSEPWFAAECDLFGLR